MASYYKPSASNLERAIKCPASSIIPIRVSSENEAAAIGTWIHKYVELLIEGLTPEAAIFRIPEDYRVHCRKTDASFLKGLVGIDSETSYALDFETGEVRFLGRGLGRNYPDVKESEFTGTLDIQARRDDTVVIIDMKSGSVTTSAKNNYQIKFAACAIAKHLGVDTVEAHLLYLREDDENFFDSHTFTREELDEAMQEFKDFYALLKKEAEDFETNKKLHLREGFHCAYCPAALSCPAKVNALNALAKKSSETDLEELPYKVSRMDPSIAPAAWKNFKQIETYWTVAEKSIKDYASKNKIVGEDFRVVKTECKTKPKPNVEKLIKLAKKLGATDEDLDSCYGVVKFTKLTTKKLDKDNKDNE